MYLHLGKDTVVSKNSVVAIFDIDNTTWSYLTRDYLSAAEKKGNVINISDDIPKSFVVCAADNGGQTVYLSQLASSTLMKRSENFVFTEP